MALRSEGVSFCARAGPPFLPPFRPAADLSGTEFGCPSLSPVRSVTIRYASSLISEGSRLPAMPLVQHAVGRSVNPVPRRTNFLLGHYLRFSLNIRQCQL